LPFLVFSGFVIVFFVFVISFYLCCLCNWPLVNQVSCCINKDYYYYYYYY